MSHTCGIVIFVSTESGNTPKRDDAKSTIPPKDLPDTVLDAIEGNFEPPLNTQKSAVPPNAEATVEADSEGTTDRSVILGRDGRWLSGWALRFIVLVIAGVIALRMLGFIWVGILPVVLALLVCTVLWPPVKWLREHKIPAALAVVITILGFFALIGGV